MQEGMDKLIANSRDGGAKKGKYQTPKDFDQEDQDPGKKTKDSDKGAKDRGKNKVAPKCTRCGIEGHNIFDCRHNPERNEYWYKC